MSKGLYLGNESLARKGSELYVGVDGKARKVSKGYIGIDGVSRQFWPSVVYVWNRYTVTNIQVYNYTIRANQTAPTGGWFSGVIRPIDIEKDFDKTTGFWTSRSTIYPSQFSNGWIVDTSNGYNNQAFYATNRSTDTSSGGQLLYHYDYPQRARSQSAGTEPAQGTYIDQVISDQSNTYPKNGQSGLYWYVYQGTR